MGQCSSSSDDDHQQHHHDSNDPSPAAAAVLSSSREMRCSSRAGMFRAPLLVDEDQVEEDVLRASSVDTPASHHQLQPQEDWERDVTNKTHTSRTHTETSLPFTIIKPTTTSSSSPAQQQRPSTNRGRNNRDRRGSLTVSFARDHHLPQQRQSQPLLQAILSPSRQSHTDKQNRRRRRSSLHEKVLWRQRIEKGKSFRRFRFLPTRFSLVSSPSSSSLRQQQQARLSVVMSTPAAESSPWEAVLAPGMFRLSDLVRFPDVSCPIPRHAKLRIHRDCWNSSLSTLSKSGSLEIPWHILQEEPTSMIPIETATELLLEFYGCNLIGPNTEGDVELHDEHVIQDFLYSQNYFEKYVRGVGAGIEVHEFAHVDCPLSPMEESGLFLLGKWGDDNDNEQGDESSCLYLTAFRVPQLHALFVPGGTIHSNDYLRGTWRTMLSWTSEEPIDHVSVCAIAEDGSKQMGYFQVEGLDHISIPTFNAPAGSPSSVPKQSEDGE